MLSPACAVVFQSGNGHFPTAEWGAGVTDRPSALTREGGVATDYLWQT